MTLNNNLTWPLVVDITKISLKLPKINEDINILISNLHALLFFSGCYSEELYSSSIYSDLDGVSSEKQRHSIAS